MSTTHGKWFVSTARQGMRTVRNGIAAALGLLMAQTEWRRRRLVILGYHGVSLEDEHLWRRSLYMTAEQFRRRLAILRDGGYTVLPFSEAVRRLYDETLPPRAVTIVFDDGFHDFARVAAPLLAEFGYSANVYLSSYYAHFNRPIFDPMLDYLLWKGLGRTLVLRGILAKPVKITEQNRQLLVDEIKKAAFAKRMSAVEKDRTLATIAGELQVDFQHLCRRRILHIMNADEVREMNAQGHEIQLHTHRHRVSRLKSLFAREISENRSWIENVSGGPSPVHLSFPGGVWQPVEQAWLKELGIATATTCRLGLADPSCDPLRLPRVMDHSSISERVFRSWLAGGMSLLPKAKEAAVAGQILEETVCQDEVETRARAATA